MANKIKCTCGHSWNKSDSSKKDVTVCHICGKNNMKDGGWLDKYDVPQAQNGIEGTMGGLTDKGFNYNGAWGGPSMQMGGAMPGSVGFTYARTKGIPSEGPYAKKTMPSAQNGKPIKKREDFEAWWNWASKKAGDVDNRQDAFGTLGDLYAYYAGQPLHYNTLEHSQYKPTNAKNPNANYISINDPKFKQEIFDKYQDVFIKGKLKTADVNKGEHPWNNEEKINDNTYAVSGYTRPTKEELEEARKQKVSPAFIKGKNHVSNAIGRYFISKGKDDKGEYISYYDVFDEGSGPDGGGMGEKLGLTKPFEIYDRIYLDPKTGKPKMQNGGEMKFYQEGLDWKPRNISRDGSITKDDNGYWNPENWGEPVEIGSNEITMRGLQEMGYNKPLLGISDTGDTQMMYPGEDYTFDGESVTEYPVAQKGISVSKPTAADSINIYNYAVAQDNYYRKNIEPYSKKTVEPYQQNFNKRVEGVRKGQQSLLNSNLPENQKKWIRENKSPYIQYGLGMGNMDNDYSKELLNKVDTRIKPQNFIRYTVEKPNIDLKDIQSITERNKPQEYMELSNLDRSTSDILLGRNKTIKQKIGNYKGKYDEVVKKLKKTDPNINIEDVVRQSDRFKEAIKQIPGWQTGRVYYDPLAVKPYNMRTPKEKIEWEKKYGKPEPTYVEKFGLTNDDIKRAFATKPIPKKDGDPYYNVSKGGKNFRIHAQSGGLDYIEEIKPPKPSVKSQPKQEVVKKQEATQPPVRKEQPKPIERKQNVYEGSPVYSPGAGIGMGSALIGFLGQKGDTTYIKPEDYERFAVPKYGKEFIESKSKKKNGGWLEKYK